MGSSQLPLSEGMPSATESSAPDLRPRARDGECVLNATYLTGHALCEGTRRQPTTHMHTLYPVSGSIVRFSTVRCDCESVLAFASRVFDCGVIGPWMCLPLVCVVASVILVRWRSCCCTRFGLY